MKLLSVKIQISFVGNIICCCIMLVVFLRSSSRNRPDITLMVDTKTPNYLQNFTGSRKLWIEVIIIIRKGNNI